jgi:tRNA threonylcarbamoyl adenosine modification protein YjeE
MGMKSAEYKNLNLLQMAEVASEIANKLSVGSVVCLSGDLGTGKTFFAAMLINKLTGKADSVTSPTFNLVHNYPSPKGEVWHFDLYRLKSQAEVQQLGIDDALRYGISIIEWPEIIQSILPENCVKIAIDFAKDESKRNLTISFAE